MPSCERIFSSAVYAYTVGTFLLINSAVDLAIAAVPDHKWLGRYGEEPLLIFLLKILPSPPPLCSNSYHRLPGRR